jgi:hypothetical protein
MIGQIVRRTFGITPPTPSAVQKEQPIPLLAANGARLLYFYEHLKSLQHVDGTVVECGVGWGRSVLLLAICQLALGQDRQIFGFDSFEGFPDPSPEDLPGKARRGHYKTNHASVVSFLVNSGLDPAFVEARIKLIPGFFSESLPKYDGRPIALLHLDVDIYSSYKETLEYFYPLVAPGGVIAFDEYQSTEKYPGARKAIDEFFADRPERIRPSTIVDRYYTVKA